MRIVIATLMLAGALTSMACESGWDLRGQVVLDPEVDRSRQLMVLFFPGADLGSDGLPRRDPGARTEPLTVLERMETQPRIGFSKFEFGCGPDAFRLVAWSPKIRRTLPATGFWISADLFSPAAGDYLVMTETLAATNCGYWGTQEVTLHLSADELPGP